MSDTWISSDWHLFHENIIKYCGRPFSNADEMNETIIEQHNLRVKPQDHFYNLGDVTMLRGGRVEQARLLSLLKRFNGHGRLILGNHDHFPVEVYLRAGFEKVKGTGQWLEHFLLSHYPVHPESLGRAAACVHGHIHEKAPPKPALSVDKHGKVHVQPYINVCVERTNYAPINLEDLRVMVREAQD